MEEGNEAGHEKRGGGRSRLRNENNREDVKRQVAKIATRGQRRVEICGLNLMCHKGAKRIMSCPFHYHHTKFLASFFGCHLCGLFATLLAVLVVPLLNTFPMAMKVSRTTPEPLFHHYISRRNFILPQS